MKPPNSMVGGSAIIACSFLLAGCGSTRQHGLTSPYHLGPAVGQTVGSGVGLVGGNVAGGVVGLGEGVVKGTVAPFNNTMRIVRTWRTETTPDGRNIQVPVDIPVDAEGRPVGSMRRK